MSRDREDDDWKNDRLYAAAGTIYLLLTEGIFDAFWYETYNESSKGSVR